MIQVLAVAIAVLLLSAGAVWAQQRGDGSASRRDLTSRLEQLERLPEPAVKMGAMCYEPMAMPERVEYVCPSCGERSIYPTTGLNAPSAWSFEQLDGCRRLLERLKKASPVPVEWDESAWCKHCSPDADKPAAYLVFRYEKGEHRVEVRADDLVLLCEFFEGSDTHITTNDGRQPLKQHAERLRQLLDLTADETPDRDPHP